MARVFISFVHEDDAVAMAVQALIAHELELEDEVFLSADRRQVFGGDIWLDKIRVALEECEVVVLMLSKRSLAPSLLGEFRSRRHLADSQTGHPGVFRKSVETPTRSAVRVDASSRCAERRWISDRKYSSSLHLNSPPPLSPYIIGLMLAGPDHGKTDRGLQQRMERYNRVEDAVKRFQDEES
jgi:hypothetical protein